MRISTTTFDDEAPSKVPEWFVTYADMMSLLLGFFIMLVSMSNFDEPKKFQTLAATLQEQFGRGQSPLRGRATGIPDDNLFNPYGEPATLAGETLYFGELETELTDASKRILVQVAHTLVENGATIEIRGHSAQVAIDPKSGILDVWDLVDRRCRAALRFLIDQRVDPARIRLANAGISELVYNGADPERLRANSRVEIRFLTNGTEGF